MKKDLILHLLLVQFALLAGCTKDDGTVDERIFVIDNAAFGISANRTNARATTDGINAAIEKACDEGYNVVRFTPGEYLITCVSPEWAYPMDGIFLQSRMTFDLGEAKFYVEPNDASGYAVFQMDRRENVTIIGGEVIGDKHEHIYPSDATERMQHQHGSGIYIYGCENILIKDMKIRAVTGDGIKVISYNYMYIYGMFMNDNVRITNCTFDDCGMRGVGIRHTENIEIDNCRFTRFSNQINLIGTGGIVTMDYTQIPIRNIKLHDNYFEDCGGGALSVTNAEDVEICDNYLENGHITIVICNRTKVYRNTVVTGAIAPLGDGGGKFNHDLCIPTDGPNKNDAKVSSPYVSINSQGFVCE